MQIVIFYNIIYDGRCLLMQTVCNDPRQQLEGPKEAELETVVCLFYR